MNRPVGRRPSSPLASSQGSLPFHSSSSLQSRISLSSTTRLSIAVNRRPHRQIQSTDPNTAGNAMGLSPGEMDEMLARLIPNDLPDDPDISYRPAPVETTPPRPASDTRRPEIPRWLLDTNSPHRRREDTPR